MACTWLIHRHAQVASISLSIAPPSEINHATVTAELASLDSISVTWFIPVENNARILVTICYTVFRLRQTV